MTDDYRELLIGCGRARDKRVQCPGHPSGGYSKEWVNLTTLDLNPHCGADLQCDLNAAPPWVVYPSSQLFERGGANMDLLAQRAGMRLQPAGMFEQAWLLESDYWDEIHAYEVLEHLGQQGDAHAFFNQFCELYRLLKPNGYLCATVPSRFSPWLWGDPSHRRVIVAESLAFLDQEQYQAQIDRRLVAGQSPTNMSDFRDSLGYRADFKLIDQHDNRTAFSFILQAVKPSRHGLSILAMNERFGKLGARAYEDESATHRKPNLSPEMQEALNQLDAARAQIHTFGSNARLCPQCGPHPQESSAEHTERAHTVAGVLHTFEKGSPL